LHVYAQIGAKMAVLNCLLYDPRQKQGSNSCALIADDTRASCSMLQHIACVQPFVGEVSSYC